MLEYLRQDRKTDGTDLLLENCELIFINENYSFGNNKANLILSIDSNHCKLYSRK